MKFRDLRKRLKSLGCSLKSQQGKLIIGGRNLNVKNPLFITLKKANNLVEVEEWSLSRIKDVQKRKTENLENNSKVS